jgi:phosphoribosylformylglycinamidine synthase
MADVRALILRAPGTNCDLESGHAFELAGARTARVHVRALLECPAQLADYQILCLPGGFSYGDDLAAGRILGSQLRLRLAGALAEFRQAGKLILGICNGFQVLLKSGLLLPPARDGSEPATLAWNASGRFEARWVELAVTSQQSPFFAGLTGLYLPVAHAEGQFVARDQATLDGLSAAGQVVLRYVARAGAAGSDAPVPYPANPNGAQGNVAGVCDATGRVCGLMPHPERFVDATQHPRWTRQGAAAAQGLAVFRNAVRYWR